MARQVYYDPFGRRVEGYQAGVKDEMALQADTRRARASDFNYDYLAPLQLQGAQREEQFAQFQDPFRRRAAPIAERVAQANLYGAELPIAQQIGRTTGDYSQAQTNDIEYGQGTYGQLAGQQRGVAVDTNRYTNAFPEANVDDVTQRMAMQLEQLGLPPELGQLLAPYLLRGTGARGANSYPTYTERNYDMEALYPRVQQNAEFNNRLGEQNWERGYREDSLRRQYDYNDVIRQQNQARYGVPGAAEGFDDGF